MRLPPVCPACLLDYLIGQEQQGGGHGDSQRLGGREVDDQFEFGRLLHRQVGGLGTLQEAIHIVGRALPLVRLARPIAEEAASLHKLPCLIYGRQMAYGRECCEPSDVLKEHRVSQDKECVRVRTGHHREGAVKRLGTARLHGVQLDAQRLGRHVCHPHLEGVDEIVGIPEDGHPGDGGEHVLEETFAVSR